MNKNMIQSGSDNSRLQLEKLIGTIRLQLDQLVSTPARILTMFCPDLEPQKIVNLRLRVRRAASANATKASINDDSLPLTRSLPPPKAQPEELRDLKCSVCQNNEQSLFVLDRKNGDITCSSCGAVACERIIHLGSQYRTFEGEEDRNHHGSAYNHRFSDAYNTATCLSRNAFSGSGGVPASGGRPSRTLHKTHAYMELNLCHLGEDLRENNKRSSNTKKHHGTRIGYKDRQKRDVFARMQHVADALDLNVAALESAKELYSKFRDSREVLQDPEGIIAACMVEAFEKVSLEGRVQLETELKRLQECSVDAVINPNHNTPMGRAMRRRLMHTTNKANNGYCDGQLTGDDDQSREVSHTHNTDSALQCKPLSSWDVNDIRMWLIYTSRVIAKEWLRKEASEGTRAVIDEVEGELVQHVLKICEYIEKTSSSGSSSSSLPVGKMMHIMNSKKLASILGSGSRSNYEIVAKAIHQKLRNLINRQAAQERRAAGRKASQLRFQQMKRKRWLEAKARKSTISI